MNIHWELAGYMASAFVLAAFYMKSMVALRIAALVSNGAFIVYGVALGLTPVWLLHVLLVPLNALRLIEALREHLARSGGSGGRPPLNDCPGAGTSGTNLPGYARLV